MLHQVFCLMYIHIPAASKQGAAKFANAIMVMVDSLQKTQTMIKLSTNQMAEMSTEEGGRVEISLGLDDLRPAADRLQQRIARDLQALMGKDRATASAIRKALKDDFLTMRLKCRAILIHLRDKIRDILLLSLIHI